MELKLVKDGAILKGYREGVYVGGFDFRTNNWEIVKRGSGKRANMPIGFNTAMCRTRDTSEQLYQCAYALVQVWDGSQDSWRYDKEQLDLAYSFLEKLASLGLCPSSLYELMHLNLNDDYKEVELKKDFVQFLKDSSRGRFSFEMWDRYKRNMHYSALYTEFGNEIVDFARDCTEGIEALQSIEMLKKLCRLIKRENVCEMMKNCWAAMKEGLKVYAMIHPDEVLPSRNLLLELCTAQKVYRENKDKYLETSLRANNDLPALYYETDEWFVRPLLTPAEFHNEAEQQGNCVERLYMEKVVRGETHVVQIRKKNNPSKSWLTVEVTNNGYIQQFLLAYNVSVRVGTEEDKVKQEYKKHLGMTWSE
jgi:hypothetical protein